jgi:hypothetical protein
MKHFTYARKPAHQTDRRAGSIAMRAREMQFRTARPVIKRRNREGQARKSRDDSDKCSECGGVGHYARDCPTSQKRTNGGKRTNNGYGNSTVHITVPENDDHLAVTVKLKAGASTADLQSVHCGHRIFYIANRTRSLF